MNGSIVGIKLIEFPLTAKLVLFWHLLSFPSDLLFGAVKVGDGIIIVNHTFFSAICFFYFSISY